MLCSWRMLWGGCFGGDALFSEEWEERVAEDALAHTGRAPWLTEVLHLASAHRHPRKVPWMEKGNLCAPCRGSDGKSTPKSVFPLETGDPASVMLPLSSLGVKAEPFPGRYGPVHAHPRLISPAAAPAPQQRHTAPAPAQGPAEPSWQHSPGQR